MALEDRPQLCGATSLGMGGFGKTLRIPQGRAIELLLSKEYDENFTKQEPWKVVNSYRIIYHVGEEDGRLDIPNNVGRSKILHT
ncbi:hypothetical protein MTR_1g009260 [Medicago truncatula]|uniref:Uncharacterized protein n=1 Tax=Medicago truncatula TaxID=3880 RepID=G7I572_MEDTR|nr:hypothetical protein MTR_1g009260 [Medicago truncatula]